MATNTQQADDEFADAVPLVVASTSSKASSAAAQALAAKPVCVRSWDDGPDDTPQIFSPPVSTVPRDTTAEKTTSSSSVPRSFPIKRTVSAAEGDVKPRAVAVKPGVPTSKNALELLMARTAADADKRARHAAKKTGKTDGEDGDASDGESLGDDDTDAGEDCMRAKKRPKTGPNGKPLRYRHADGDEPDDSIVDDSSESESESSFEGGDSDEEESDEGGRAGKRRKTDVQPAPTKSNDELFAEFRDRIRLLRLANQATRLPTVDEKNAFIAVVLGMCKRGIVAQFGQGGVYVLNSLTELPAEVETKSADELVAAAFGGM